MNNLTSIVRRIDRAQRRAWTYARSPMRITAHSDVVFGRGIRVGRGRRLEVGERTFIGNNFTCMSSATIGPDVMVSSNVALIGDDHPFDDPTRTLTEIPPNPPGHVIVVGNNLIGFGTIIIGSVTIGEGAIIAAGSLVTTDLEPDTVYAGRPARPMRGRYQ